MGYEYGRKVHAVIDTDSLSIQEWCKCQSKFSHFRQVNLPLYPMKLEIKIIDDKYREIGYFGYH